MKKASRQLWIIFQVIVGILIMAVFAVPFLWMISTSLKTLPEALIFPPKWIPEYINWENFKIAWKSGPFLRYLCNSIFVSASILILQFITIIPAAYAFARYQFNGKNVFFAITLITLMIPNQLIFLPVYLMLSSWGLVNTLSSLILPFASSALGIFLLRQSFKQVPEELIEAALLDNAGEWRIITRIMIPMSRATLATFALLSFITSWNDYFWPLVMTTSPEMRTLPLGVASIIDAEGPVSWNVLMAGNMILVVPILIVFIFARQKITKAFVYFGIK